MKCTYKPTRPRSNWERYDTESQPTENCSSECQLFPTMQEIIVKFVEFQTQICGTLLPRLQWQGSQNTDICVWREKCDAFTKDV